LKISQTLLSSAPGPSQHDASAAPLHSPGVYDPQLEACEEDLVRAKNIDIYCRLSSDVYIQETLVRAANTYDNLQVDYDIILSDTYQVPVLYFVLRQADKLLGMDEVYRYLVPSQYRENIQGVGIMGGISFGVRASNFKLTLEHVLIYRSIIQSPEPHHISCIRATPRML
jgi:hypothetical protein